MGIVFDEITEAAFEFDLKAFEDRFDFAIPGNVSWGDDGELEFAVGIFWDALFEILDGERRRWRDLCKGVLCGGALSSDSVVREFILCEVKRSDQGKESEGVGDRGAVTIVLVMTIGAVVIMLVGVVMMFVIMVALIMAVLVLMIVSAAGVV